MTELGGVGMSVGDFVVGEALSLFAMCSKLEHRSIVGCGANVVYPLLRSTSELSTMCLTYLEVARCGMWWKFVHGMTLLWCLYRVRMCNRGEFCVWGRSTGLCGQSYLVP